MSKFTVVKKAYDQSYVLYLPEMLQIQVDVAVMAFSVSAHSKLLARTLTYSKLVLHFNICFEFQVFHEVFLCEEP